MDNEQIQRSRLYRENFLPGAVIRLRNQANARVVGVRNNDIALDLVDRTQLVDAVRQFLAVWEEGGGKVDQGLRDAVEHNRLTVQSPSEVYVSPYPLLLCCERCRVIDFYDPRQSEERAGEAIKRRIRRVHGRTQIACKTVGCGGSMLQVPYVGVHRCGVMQPVHVPHTARRKDRIGFRDVGGSFFNNYFFDVETGDKLAGALQDDCPACRHAFAGASEISKRGTPVTSGESFYPQLVQYIALSKKAGALTALLNAQIGATHGTLAGPTCDIAEGMASVLLGILDSAELERQLRAMLEDCAPSDQMLQQHTQELAKKVAARDKYSALAEDDEMMADMLALVNARIAELDALLAIAGGRFKAVRQLLDNEATLLALVSERRTLEAVFLRHDVRRLSVTQSIATCGDAVARATRSDHWDKLCSRYGVADIAHIPDLLVVLSALGYTRERRAPTPDSDAPPVVLNGFEDTHDESLRGRCSLYAMSANTEALWIKLDPARVLRWCVEQAGWAPVGAAVLASPALAHAHLLQHSPALTMSPGDVQRQCAGEHLSHSAPFHLLHTLCHALLATSRRHTGYDDQSLMEYLLPMDLSFVIYVTSVQNFTAGGLLTMFQHYLLPWFDDASAYAFNCAFDPICSDSGGACSGCIQRERACETFNYGLSRAYLHGGNTDRDYAQLIEKGFWDAGL